MLEDERPVVELREWVGDLLKDRQELTEKVRDARQCARECAQYVPLVEFEALQKVWTFLCKDLDELYVPSGNEWDPFTEPENGSES